MKKIFAVLLSVLIIVSSMCVSASALGTKKRESKKKQYVEGEAIVVLKDSAGADYTKAKKASSVYGKGITLKNSMSFKKKSENTRMAVLKSSSISTNDMISSLKKNAEVQYAFPNYKKKITSLTNDAYSKFQWPLENNGQNNGKKGIDIKAEKLREDGSKTKDENVVAVLDTGIDYKNEELKDVLWHNPYGNKLLGQYGCDLSETFADFKPMDDHGHGTHIAGIIASKSDNEKGISGVCKSGVKIMSVKVVKFDGSTSTECMLAGFEYIKRAAELGTKISAVNCSIGGDGDEYEKKAFDDVFNALGEKGIITCVASGNESINFNNIDDPDSEDYEMLCTPACCDSPYCITVAASNENGDIVDYSNVGDRYVDVAAPGVNILSDVSENCFNPSIYTDEERGALCAYYQDYNGALDTAEFGKPKLITESENGYNIWEKTEAGQSDSFFGLSGKSLTVTPTDKKEKKNVRYAFEIPFTLDNEDDKYRVSFMVKSDTELEGYFSDMPADMNYDEFVDDYEYYSPIAAWGKNDWTHYEFLVDTGDKDYVKAKSRKILFVIDSDSKVYLDDLSVSKQSVNEDDFGKYDFYSGTSMATPFVTGAVALLKNKNSELSALDIVNMVSNSGEKNETYKDKIKNSNFLTLDTLDNIPPVIKSVSYNGDGNVKIDGSLKGITKVYVNDKEVTPLKNEDNSVIISDNKYSTYKINVKLENEYGSDAFETLLSKKTDMPLTDKVDGYPEDTSSGIMVTAGNKAYFIDTSYGTIGTLETVTPKKSYVYDSEETVSMGLKDIFDGDRITIASAAYANNRIYFTAYCGINTSNNLYTIGYDTVFGYYDLKTEKTTKLCEIPDESILGSSLAVYKNNFYLIGGYNFNELEYIDSVYKYDSAKKQFTKTAFNLPEPRAYTEFVECDGKLVGMYGGVKSGKMPSAIIFDGKNWKQSSCKFESDDGEEYVYSEEKKVNAYFGNIGLDKNGVFCNGCFVSGLGDTFTYDVKNDKIIECKYCYHTDDTKPELIGTTVSGAFIGFTVNSLSDDIILTDSLLVNPLGTDDPFTSGVKTYMVELDNTSVYPMPKPSVTPDDDISPEKNDPKSDKSNTSDSKAKLSKTSVSLKAGATKTLTVSGGKAKSWNSSKNSVVKVKNGKITALKKGTAKITVTLTNGKKLTCNVKVTTSPSIKINGKKFKSSKTYSVKKGKKLKVAVTGKASSVKNVYKSSNKKIAKVISPVSAKNIKIKAYKKGKATVTVKVNGVNFKIKVKVKK